MPGLPLPAFQPTIKRKADYAFAIGPFVDLFICPEDFLILIEYGDSLVQLLDHPEGIRKELFLRSVISGVTKNPVETLLLHQAASFAPVISDFDIEQGTQLLRRGHLGRCSGFHEQDLGLV